jgi:CDP-diacylglycerol--serine O-phosphatidyltransferase
MIKKHIPNTITLLNLSSGAIAILLATRGFLKEAAIMVIAASVFDFFDGFAARLLHVKSAIGKELDSLADMVSFGVAPAMIMYALLCKTEINSPVFYKISVLHVFIALLFPCFVALRLAKFNLDTRQTELFYGLPSPAAAFVLISFPFFSQKEYSFLMYVSVILILCVFMLANIPLLSLKFKDFSLKNNIFRYILIAISAILLIFLTFRSIPFIILTYICLSFINNFIQKKNVHGNS